jgi:hypothetical protein
MRSPVGRSRSRDQFETQLLGVRVTAFPQGMQTNYLHGCPTWNCSAAYAIAISIPPGLGGGEGDDLKMEVAQMVEKHGGGSSEALPLR